MAYLSPWARLGRGLGRFRELSAFRAFHRGLWARAPGLCPWARALDPGPVPMGPWACALGPEPWAQALGLCPWARKVSLS